MGLGRYSRREPRRWRRHLTGTALALAVGTAAVVGPGTAGAGPAHGAHRSDRIRTVAGAAAQPED